MDAVIYGYCRVSTSKQNIDRQVRNILAEYPSAHIVKEVFTGTITEERREWAKLIHLAKQEADAGKDVTIVFDQVSRMSRNAEDGFNEYRDMYQRGIRLVFLKEAYINTDTFKKALTAQVPMTGSSVDIILTAVNEYLMVLAQEQIRLAFSQAEKEVLDLRQRTSEGIKTAKLNGKQIGRVPGRKYETKKAVASKEIILRNSRDFNGSNSDAEVMKIAGISRNTLYKYKRELREQ